MSVEDFIFRVERLQCIYNYPWDEITESFHHLLGENVSRWYWLYIRQRANRVINWENLRLDLLREFQQFSANCDVLRQIMDRVQGKDEKTGQFIDAVLTLRTQLRQPLTDAELIDIIQRNLKPRILALVFGTPAYSMEHFRTMCKKAEEVIAYDWQRRAQQSYNQRNIAEVQHQEMPQQSYQQRNIAEIQLQEIPQQNYQQRNIPEIEWQGRPQITYQQQQNVPGIEWKETSDEAEVDALQAGSKVQCWNCKQFGHICRNCPSTIRRLFCFKCGLDDVTSPMCPRCQGNGRNPLSSTGEIRSTSV